MLDRFVPEIPSDFYDLTLQRRYGLVQGVRRAFELLKPEGLAILRKWVEGDEFDYRALLDFALDKKAGLMPSDRLYIKRIKQHRDVAVMLLVESLPLHIQHCLRLRRNSAGCGKRSDHPFLRSIGSGGGPFRHCRFFPAPEGFRSITCASRNLKSRWMMQSKPGSTACRPSEAPAWELPSAMPQPSSKKDQLK